MIYPFEEEKTITQKFGQGDAAITGGIHKGLDLAANYGTPVRAVAAGTVVGSGYSSSGGNYVVIDTGDINVGYYHLSQRLVGYGQVVAEGQQIGLVGSTGWSTGPHLHLQFERGGVAIDPLPYISGQVQYSDPAAMKPNSDGYYTMRQNDTFWGLEERWGIPHGTLQQANPELDPRTLQIGQRIRTSAAQSAAPAATEQYYTIQQGDTFWALEEGWQLSHGTLQQLNPGQDPRTLQIGQRIRIK